MFARLGLATLVRLNAVLMVAFLMMTEVLTRRLPPRVAAHFDRNGAANRWSDPGVLWIFPLACVAIIIVVHLVGTAVSRAAESSPSTNKGVTLDSSPSHRTFAADRLRRLSAWTGIGITFMFMAIQFGMYRVDVNGLDVLPTGFVWYPIAGFAFTLFVILGAARSTQK